MNSTKTLYKSNHPNRDTIGLQNVVNLLYSNNNRSIKYLLFGFFIHFFIVLSSVVKFSDSIFYAVFLLNRNRINPLSQDAANVHHFIYSSLFVHAICILVHSKKKTTIRNTIFNEFWMRRRTDT